MKRYALVNNAESRRQLEAYLPENYRIVHEGLIPGVEGFSRTPMLPVVSYVIAGEDSHGWTLDGCVIPRLGSGLIWAQEIDLSHPVMKQVPLAALNEGRDEHGVKVHRFGSTGEAYDASQCDDGINDGDVLVVESENAVAVLIEAWPVAIDSQHAGEAFHVGIDAFDWAKVDLTTGQQKDYTASLEAAKGALCN